MPKDIPQPTNPPTGQANQREQDNRQQEPLSGSKSVKNRNHSRNNHAEGS
ncbi:small acid-soluble spore protein P [Paenibacillus aurantius]|uniref:Small acid-soluble spore protein P n=1 Tax=Paenibacillus aurantius TaxID=2918900 RepID=A0AA96LHG8_9BACL|nr:small acid-soluble spore protein P [Paenibacillus aurantius]WNQ11522.1 small acid-soluble spore protein P [Paenibacillus aurantius]